jgi:hypothetical protein
MTASANLDTTAQMEMEFALILTNVLPTMVAVVVRVAPIWKEALSVPVLFLATA